MSSPLRSLVACVAVLSFCLTVGAACEARAQGVDWVVKLGEELDTNPLRLVDDGDRVDSGTRLFGQVDWSQRLGESFALTLWSRGGARWVHGETDASAATGEAGFRVRHRVGARGGWGVSGDARERVEVLSLRDFRRLDARVDGWVVLVPGWLRASAWGGWADFVFRPVAALSWSGPQAGASLVFDASDAWQLAADVTASFRRVRERDLVAGDAGLMFGEERREDRWMRAALRAEYLGDTLLVRAGPSGEWNRSTSFGRGYTRFGASVDATWIPLGDLRVFAESRLEWAFFTDPALIDVGLLLEDENRNRFAVAVDHPLWRWIAVEARYELHTSSLSGDDTARYRRHLGYLGLVLQPED